MDLSICYNYSVIFHLWMPSGTIIMSDICTGNRVGVIDSLEKELSKKCFATHRHPLDWERSSVIEYDFCDHSYAEKPGETERILGSKDISRIAEDWRDSAPAFRFFLDGSRRTYKIADIPIDMQCYPLVAGQVGVGVWNEKTVSCRCMEIFT